MLRIEREIVINLPVDEVFGFLATGRNEAQYNPHLLRAADHGRAWVTTRGRFREMAYEITADERPGGS